MQREGRQRRWAIRTAKWAERFIKRRIFLYCDFTEGRLQLRRFLRRLFSQNIYEGRNVLWMKQFSNVFDTYPNHSKSLT
jgi:hypothetical protein